MTYHPRIVDRELAERLQATGAVVIEGPRACGKTTTARQIAASEARLDVDDVARRLASLEPARVLIGGVPRLIDEWQLEPAIWNHVRRAVDDRRLPGQFILTGSAVPADDATRHTGAGRLTRLRMRPLSLFELGHSSGEVSLAGLLDGERARAGRSVIPLDDLTELICVGGWPVNLGRTTQLALRANRDHLDEIPSPGHRQRRRQEERPGQGGHAPSVPGTECRDPGGDRDPRLRHRRRRVRHQGAHGRRVSEGAGTDHDRGEPAALAHTPEIEVGSQEQADPAPCGSLTCGGRGSRDTRPAAPRPRLPGASLRVDGRTGSAGLRPGRGCRGVSLPREGRPGGGRDRAVQRRSLGRLRGQARRGAGG